jgi:16S rRNA (guanine1516-N2)-methyltransferase
MRTPVAVAIDSFEPQRSAALAERLRLPLLSASVANPPADCVAWLCYSDGRLQLQPCDPRQSGPVVIDFSGGASRWRLQGGAELIARAVAGRSKQPLRVLDATAGLGRDSFVLASRGFRVHMLERSPVLAALLDDALQRARRDDHAEVAVAAERLSLSNTEALDYLAAMTDEQRPDVIYLDPMFPPSPKTALVKKEMRLLQQLFHGDETDHAALLAAARAGARLRVVVKRPRNAAPLADVAAAYCLEGKAVRFDVYAG